MSNFENAIMVILKNFQLFLQLEEQFQGLNAKSFFYFFHSVILNKIGQVILNKIGY